MLSLVAMWTRLHLRLLLVQLKVLQTRLRHLRKSRTPAAIGRISFTGNIWPQRSETHQGGLIPQTLLGLFLFLQLLPVFTHKHTRQFRSWLLKLRHVRDFPDLISLENETWLFVCVIIHLPKSSSFSGNSAVQGRLGNFCPPLCCSLMATNVMNTSDSPR